MIFKAFVFDLDGTLVDSKIDFSAMRAELRLSAAHDILAHVEQLGSDQRQAALEVIYKYERAGAEASVPIQGARELIDHARRAGHPCAVFTRNANALARLSLEMHGFEMDLVIAREDAPPKPKPDGLIKIADAFKLKISELLFVGDYVYDLQAGLAAGAPTALFLTAPADFKTDGADFIFNSYGELKTRLGF